MADLRTLGPARGGVDPAVARRTWRLAEPLHAMIYFAPERERYQRIGLRGQRMGYFASRSAAFGTPGPETVIATFYNFAPGVVRRAIPDAWRYADPATILATRVEVADAALRRVLGSTVDSPEMAEAAALSRRAAQAAARHSHGRPLFAAHLDLPWPDAPHLALWHAQTLLREFRGDGHVAALTTEGLSGIEALISHSASGAVDGEVLRASRGWTEQEWADAVRGMRARGIVTSEFTLTDEGRAQRRWLEDRTDALSVPAYSALGADGCARLAELVRPWVTELIAAGLLPTEARH